MKKECLFQFLPFFIIAMLLVHGCKVVNRKRWNSFASKTDPDHGGGSSGNDGMDEPREIEPLEPEPKETEPKQPEPQSHPGGIFEPDVPKAETDAENPTVDDGKRAKEETRVIMMIEVDPEGTVVKWAMDESEITGEVSGYTITITKTSAAIDGEGERVTEEFCDDPECRSHPLKEKLGHGDYKVQVVAHDTNKVPIDRTLMYARIRIPEPSERNDGNVRTLLAISIIKRLDTDYIRVKWTLDKNVMESKGFKVTIKKVDGNDRGLVKIFSSPNTPTFTFETKLQTDVFYRVNVEVYGGVVPLLTMMSAGFKAHENVEGS